MTYRWLLIPRCQTCGHQRVRKWRRGIRSGHRHWRRRHRIPWNAQCASDCPPRASGTSALRATATASTAGAAFALAAAPSAKTRSRLGTGIGIERQWSPRCRPSATTAAKQRRSVLWRSTGVPASSVPPPRTAATAGCGWEGMAAGHAAHEKTCPLAQNALLQQQVAANLLEMFFSNEIT